MQSRAGRETSSEKSAPNSYKGSNSSLGPPVEPRSTARSLANQPIEDLIKKKVKSNLSDQPKIQGMALEQPPKLQTPAVRLDNLIQVN